MPNTRLGVLVFRSSSDHAASMSEPTRENPRPPWNEERAASLVGKVVLIGLTYRDSDERGWVLCRLLSFLGTSFFDDVRRTKEHYEHDAIELVAEIDGEIVGLIDVECEREPGTICEDRSDLGGMIWHLAVLRDFRRRGIASRLLATAEDAARQRGIERLEAWTRDDPWVQAWYESQGFTQTYSYLHVYVRGRDEIDGAIGSELPGLKPLLVFAQYTDEEGRDGIRARFERVHDCVCYERRF